MIPRPKIKVVLRKRNGEQTSPDFKLNTILTDLKNSKTNFFKKRNLARLKNSKEYKSRLGEFKDNRYVTKRYEKEKLKDIARDYKKEIHEQISKQKDIPIKRKIYLLHKTRTNYYILLEKTKKYYFKPGYPEKQKTLHDHVEKVRKNIENIPDLKLIQPQTIQHI